MLHPEIFWEDMTDSESLEAVEPSADQDVHDVADSDKEMIECFEEFENASNQWQMK